MIKSKSLGPFDCFGAEALGYLLRILTVDRSCHVPWKSMSLRTLVGWQTRRNAKEGARSKDISCKLLFRALFRALAIEASGTCPILRTLRIHRGLGFKEPLTRCN